jgi:hypothetical protein
MKELAKRIQLLRVGSLTGSSILFTTHPRRGGDGGGGYKSNPNSNDS